MRFFSNTTLENQVCRPKSGINLYPFGAPMGGSRSFQSSTGYRYGMNGQEKVDEISGDGNHYTAEFWQYDTRLGRRWNLDPKPQISISDYACFANNPIWYNDVKGDEAKETEPKVNKEKEKSRNNEEFKPSKEPMLILPDIIVTPIKETKNFISNFFNKVSSGVKKILYGMDNKIDKFTNYIRHTKLGSALGLFDLNRKLDTSDPDHMSKINSKGDGILNKDDQDEEMEPFIFGGKKDYYRDPTAPEFESQPVLKQADSIDVMYLINGHPTLVRKPKDPVDNNHVDGIIKSGSRKGQTEKLINNNW